MRRTLLAALVTALIFILFAACSAGDSRGQTEPTQTTGETSGTTVAESTGPAESTTPAQTSGTQPADDRTTAVTTTAPQVQTTVQADRAPATTAEIVACFNEAANKIKQEKPGYRFSVESATDRDQITIDTEIPFKNFITRFIASGINQETKSTVARGENHNDFPVKGQAVASKLEADAIKSASCMQSGDFYIIELHFKDEKLDALPEKPFGCRHGNAFSLILASDFREAFGGINIDMPGFHINVENRKFAPTYTSSSITCTINASDIRMTQAKYVLNTLCVVETQIDVNNKNYPMTITFDYSVTESYVFT